MIIENLYSIINNSFETFLKPSCRIDKNCLFQTQILHLRKNYDNKKQTEIITETHQDQTSVESNTNPTEITKKIQCKTMILPTLRFLN